MVFGKHPYRELEAAIGYRFRNRGLLDAALTHPSYRYETDAVDIDNQRLEFLGDAILGMETASYVYEKFPNKEEGALTALRSQITSGKALSRIARALDLGPNLRMGKGEERSGGRKRPSNLADALEALIGAAYLDGGARAARKVFNTVFAREIDTLGEDVWAHNPKGKLQEYCQARWKAAPEYQVVASEGPAHAVHFTVSVTLPDRRQASGQGTSKQAAEALAARNMLQALTTQPTAADAGTATR